MPRARIKSGDVFMVPVDDDRVGIGSYVGRVQSTDTWMGGGREWVSQGSIPYEQLGTFTRVPWSAYGN